MTEGRKSFLAFFNSEDDLKTKHKPQSERKVLEDCNHGEDYLDESDKEYRDKSDDVVVMTQVFLFQHTTIHWMSKADKELETIETTILVEEPSFIEDNNTSALAPTTTISDKTAEDSPRA
uniref:Uncharacterized protein n=1 Tax=Oryza meridionalis TaxID=40149 RepID=A0A0E0CI30_9ORYZ